MTSTVRLTPAQRRGLALLATPGAVARSGRVIRWNVYVGDDLIGSIHAGSLMTLRASGYAEMFNGGEHPLDFRQQITDRGRAAIQAQGAEVPA